MTRPEDVLDHAERLLAGASSPADLRRSISAAYYALFHRLTGEAGERVSRNGFDDLRTAVARSATHRDLARVCDAILRSAPAVPDRLRPALVAPISPDLTLVCEVFSDLQKARHAADYDLGNDPSPTDAERHVRNSRVAFETFERIAGEPNTQGFLIALLLSDRWTRSG